MVRLVRWLLAPALLGFVLAGSALAQGRPESVQDEAALFSRAAKAQANAEIARMRSQFKKELEVDTVVSVKVPSDIDANDKAAVNRFFDNWAEKRFQQERIDGVYVVIVQDPPKVRIRVGNKTEQAGWFRAADRQALENELIANLKETRADPDNQAKKDRVLLAATAFVHERMSQHARSVAEQRQAPAGQHQGAQQGGGTPLMTYILIGIGIFLVIWLIRGIVRGLSGGGVGGPGMAGGGYGGGGGGGGFFSSMLGGLFGAAAGMWMYNNVFGGHSNSAWGAGPDAGAGPNSGNDADTNSTGGGGDYGDTGSSGGDQGGGDWGGGGGGDAGGGGDWGGGGGGDFGGGGGDFGGGGGGDW